jgi:hypothetical protein
MRFTRWDQVASSGETNDFCFALSKRFSSRIQDESIRSLFEALIESRNIEGIVDYEVQYSNTTPYDCSAIRQIQAFFSKRADLVYGRSDLRTRAALGTFIASEVLCRETNVIFEKISKGEFQFPPRVEQKLFFAKRKISSILGDVPSLEALHLRFGPGATTSIPKRIASARRKLGTSFACSEELLPVVKDVLEQMQGWIPFKEESDTCRLPVEVHTGKLRLVPKSLKTHRSVVVEPVLNSMVQCGIGDYMAGLLRRNGLDIRRQEPNQFFAMRGSESGDLATLDLSSASDTVAIELIYALLPVDWALFLSQFRTGTVEYEGYPIRLEKFS